MIKQALVTGLSAIVGKSGRSEVRKKQLPIIQLHLIFPSFGLSDFRTFRLPHFRTSDYHCRTNTYRYV